jgi:hypothetical protein
MFCGKGSVHIGRRAAHVDDGIWRESCGEENRGKSLHRGLPLPVATIVWSVCAACFAVVCVSDGFFFNDKEILAMTGYLRRCEVTGNASMKI